MTAIHFNSASHRVGETLTACGLDLDEWYFATTGNRDYVTCKRCLQTADYRVQADPLINHADFVARLFPAEQIAVGLEVLGVENAPTDLYRYFDADAQLIYVGISISAFMRAKAHRNASGWWRHAVAMTIVRYPSREAAIAAELEAIRAEKPKYNLQGREL